jgi:hypothetical protein
MSETFIYEAFSGPISISLVFFQKIPSKILRTPKADDGGNLDKGCSYFKSLFANAICFSVSLSLLLGGGCGVLPPS